jgi:hypothetical protein
MAEEMNVTRSLFGLGPAALGLKPAADEVSQVENRAIAASGLDAMQYARYTANRGAALAGHGLGKAALQSGLFGEQAIDPRVKLAQTTQAVMRQVAANGIDPTDTVAFRKAVAQGLGQAGYPNEANMLMAEVQQEELEVNTKRVLIDKNRAAAAKDESDVRNAQTPFQKIIATGKFTPASLSLFQKTGNVEDLSLADDKYEKVETDDGVYMVNKTDPKDRLRIGDNKSSESTDQWMLNKWRMFTSKATDPKTGKLDWSKLTAAEQAEAKAIASSTRVFGKEGALAYFGDLAQNLGVEESKALAGVLRAEAFNKEFTGITREWLPKGDVQSVMAFEAALKNAGAQGIAPAMVFNKVKDPQAARYISSAIRYINAILRRESGAAVTESEWQRYGAGYVPMPNDTPEAIAEKERARSLWPQAEIDAFSPAMKNAYKNAASRNMDMTPGAAKLNIDNPLVAAGVAAKRQGPEAYRKWWGTLSAEEKATFKKELTSEKK